MNDNRLRELGGIEERAGGLKDAATHLADLFTRYLAGDPNIALKQLQDLRDKLPDPFMGVNSEYNQNYARMVNIFKKAIISAYT